MKVLLVLFALVLASPAQGKINVVTTTTTLADFVKTLGDNELEVISLTTSNQDPHFVEAKPSYMFKLNRADLLVSVGLDLEVGWLGNVQRGAKNPVIMQGQAGFFSAGEHVTPIDIPKEKVDRAKGDVHAKGNPHFHLDPERAIAVVAALAQKMAELDPKNAESYLARSKTFANTINDKLVLWKKRIEASGVTGVITYHKSLNYFLERFGIKNMADIEPLPGVPPTAKHVQYLIKLVRDRKVKCILNESYFETTAAERLKKEAAVNIQIVPVEVVTTYVDLIESLVKAVEACKDGK